MKTWREHEEFLSAGEWHIHTTYTDGENTVFEYCECASELSVPLLAFTEHVRRNLSYDFSKFLEDIDKARQQFTLRVLSGCEAKVLPDGTLDADEDILEAVDYTVFAFHSFPNDFDMFTECLKTIIRNRYVNAWAHPGRFLRRNNFKMGNGTLKEVLQRMRRNDVLLEVGRECNTTVRQWLPLASRIGVMQVRANNIHSVRELTALQKALNETAQKH